jgi:hypothetical protein
MLSELAEWQTTALERARELMIAPDSINEALGVLQSVLGEDWLKSALGRDPAHPIAFRKHPIGNLITPAGDIQIAGTLELVEYLKAAAASPVFADLVAGLKAAYGSTFLQLAFGYRFRRLGAVGLQFEPPVERGRKGDLAFEIEGTRIIAECYIPRVRRNNVEANWLLMQALELRKSERPAVLSIAVKLKRGLSGPERKSLLRLLADLARQVDDAIAADRLSDDSRYEETETAHVSVARSRSVGPGEHSLGRQHIMFPDLREKEPFVFGRVGVSRAADVRPGRPPKERETRDCVAIWLADDEEKEQSLKKDLDEPLDDLGFRLERKLAQTKESEEVGRLLIVSTWIAQEFHRASPDAIAILRRRLFGKHQNVSGLLLVGRHSWRQPSRKRYQIMALLPSPEFGLSHAMIARLNAMETELSIPAVVA